MKYAEVRIDLAKNFPVTVYGDVSSGRKNRKFILADIVSAEDLPILINQIEGVLAGKQNALQAHARIKTDEDYSFFLIMCVLQKEKFGKAHLEGLIFDATDYLEFAKADRVLIEYKNRNKEKADLIYNRELTLTGILDIEYLRLLQTMLSNGGVYSAIYDDSGNLVCASGNSNEEYFPSEDFVHVRRADIKINRAIAAQWVITAPTAYLLEKNIPLLEVLVQAVSRIANSFVLLYSEMNNSEHANKLLSEHIEQQILTNNVYNIILERKDSTQALEEVVRLVGDYMQMSRIHVYTDSPEEKTFKLYHEWKTSACSDSPPTVYSYSDMPKVITRLDYSDMYIPVSLDEDGRFNPESCTVANLNGDGKRFGVMAFSPAKPGYVPTAQESKVLRSISQITATLLLQGQADEKLKETGEKLRNLAFFDQVLNMPNRAKLDEDLESELKSKVRGAAAVVKITNLHTFNELFGHKYTDGMLRNAAHYISKMSASNSDMPDPDSNTPEINLTVYRFSGNTLMLLLREADEKNVKVFIEKLLSRFGKPWKHESGEHYLDAGIGVAFYPDGHSSRDEIYRAADLALYRATEYGTNDYAFYSKEFKTEADNNYADAQKLRTAISDGMKGFSLKYQPVTDFNNHILCYEAFVSWGGFPTPKLIQLAENMGLDIIIDSWVIKNACAFCKKMQEYEPGFNISVNITPRELRSGSIISTVEEALLETGLDSGSLSLEIPERSFSDRQDGVLSILKKLRDNGVRLIIDSFGEDFGGLRLLKHSLMDMVKMDFSLFTNIFGDFDEILVTATAKLASSLKNGICVKRVEETAQLERAKDFGVKYVQGYLYAKPVSGEEIAKKMQKQFKGGN